MDKPVNNKNNRLSWDDYFMAMAKLVSIRSTCSSRAVGAIAVRDNRILVTGYNGPPSGQAHCIDNSTEDFRYCLRRQVLQPDGSKAPCPGIHAEENIIDEADRQGISLVGATVYTTLAPCTSCTSKLAEAGVVGVYYELPFVSTDAVDSANRVKQAAAMFTTYGQITISPTNISRISEHMQQPSSQRGFAMSRE